MKKRHLGAAFVAALLVAAPLALAQDGHSGHHGRGAKEETACEVCSLHGEHGKAMAEMKALLEEARSAAAEAKASKAVEKLDRALAKLEDRRKSMEATMKAHMEKAHGGTGHDSTVVNATCPMMGGKVDPAKLDASLIREFDGKKIGFCCKGCPAKWDRLSDQAKREKLEKAIAGAHGEGGGGHCD